MVSTTVRKGPKVGGGGMNGDRVAIGGVSNESSVIMGNTNSPPRTERKGEETEEESRLVTLEGGTRPSDTRQLKPRVISSQTPPSLASSFPLLPSQHIEREKKIKV